MNISIKSFFISGISAVVLQILFVNAAYSQNDTYLTNDDKYYVSLNLKQSAKKNKKPKKNKLTWDQNIKLGFGDTTKPSDTRFAAQWCRSNRINGRRVVRSFVPGSADRIFNNSLTPCTRISKARLFCGEDFISEATLRPGCPNNRSTFDFCSPNRGGVRAIDQACKGRKMTVEVTSGKNTFCYNPPKANATFRNGRLEPNRVR